MTWPEQQGLCACFSPDRVDDWVYGLLGDHVNLNFRIEAVSHGLNLHSFSFLPVADYPCQLAGYALGGVSLVKILIVLNGVMIQAAKVINDHKVQPEILVECGYQAVLAIPHSLPK